MEINISKNPLKEAGEWLTEILKSNAGAPALLLLPGGSALSVLDFVDFKFLTPNLTIGFGDERYTDFSGGLNIDLAEKSNFFKKAGEVGCAIIDPRKFLNRGVRKAGEELEQAIRLWRKNNPSGKIILLAGFGPDGHTFAIFPLEPEDPKKFSELFENPEIWAIGHSIGKKGYLERFTITLPFIRMADYAVIYGVGEDKLGAVKAIFAESGRLSQTPSRVYREIKSAKFFTDRTD